MTRRLSTSAINALAAHGWCSFRDAELASNILLVGYELGTPVCHPGQPIVTVLSPHEKESARPNSTSAMYGRDAFPLHTDMAHWPLPPRYMVLRARVPASDFPTVLIDSHKIELSPLIREQCHRASWKVVGVKKSFLCSMFFSHNGISGFRWDVCTMVPYGPLAKSVTPTMKEALERLLKKEPISMNWESHDDLLIIDNWRMVHMRPAINESAQHRTLERVLIQEASGEHP